MRTLRWTSRAHLAILIFCGAFVFFCSCSEEQPTGIDGDNLDLAGASVEIPPPTSPENLIRALVAIYNAGDLPAAERLRAYANLFPPADHPDLDFTFFFQPRDVALGTPSSWGLEDELQATGNMFAAQDRGEIHTIALGLTIADVGQVELVREGQRQGRIRVLATQVGLSVLTGPDEGMRVANGAAEFHCVQAGDRWYIVEWRDLPMNP